MLENLVQVNCSSQDVQEAESRWGSVDRRTRDPAEAYHMQTPLQTDCPFSQLASLSLYFYCFLKVHPFWIHQWVNLLMRSEPLWSEYLLTLLRTLLCSGLSFNTALGHLLLGGHFRPSNPNSYENANNGNAISQGTCAFITDVLTVPAPLMGDDIYQCTAHSACPPFGALDFFFVCVCVLKPVYAPLMEAMHLSVFCVLRTCHPQSFWVLWWSRKNRFSSAFISAKSWKQRFILQCSSSFPEWFVSSILLHSFSPRIAVLNRRNVQSISLYEALLAILFWNLGLIQPSRTQEKKSRYK